MPEQTFWLVALRAQDLAKEVSITTEERTDRPSCVDRAFLRSKYRSKPDDNIATLAVLAIAG
jgi:hypothetical protein